MHTMLMLLAEITPTTISWSPSVGIIMSAANLFAVFIGYFAIKNPGKSQGLPVPQLASKKPFGLAELLATMSFGHILGAGLVLGLASTGALH